MTSLGTRDVCIAQTYMYESIHTHSFKIVFVEAGEMAYQLKAWAASYGTRFNSQYTHDTSQLFITQAPMDLTHSQASK